MEQTNTLLSTPDPDQDWDGQPPADKMSDVQVMTENPVAYVMDHEDHGNRITYECWTPTNEKLEVSCLYPNHMEQDSKLVDFLDAAGIPRTDPTAYDDGTTVPVHYDETGNSWEITYGNEQCGEIRETVGQITGYEWKNTVYRHATPARVSGPLLATFITAGAVSVGGELARTTGLVWLSGSIVSFVIASAIYSNIDGFRDQRDIEHAKTWTWLGSVFFVLLIIASVAV